VYKPNFPKSSSPAANSNDQSMLNLYLKEEAKESQLEASASDKLSHSVFNLYEKPTFPEQSQLSETATDRSMMNLYLKEEQTQAQ
jgi:bacterioferritin (cytochrome b1)